MAGEVELVPRKLAGRTAANAVMPTARIPMLMTGENFGLELAADRVPEEQSREKKFAFGVIEGADEDGKFHVLCVRK